MRIDPEQKWHPVYLLQPLYNLLLMAFFEWGVALHDMDYEAIRKGEKSKAEVQRQVKGIVGKAKSQVVKDYIAWPLLSGLATAGVELALEAVADRREPGARRRRGGLAGNLRRSLGKGARGVPQDRDGQRDRQRRPQRLGLRDHLLRPLPRPDLHLQQAEVEDETPGGWYVRQLSGSANIEGGPFFHVASGNLGFQVEHHLFPDLPSTRYAEIAPQVKDICERYGLPYNSGPFMQQLGMVQRTILRLALPGGEHAAEAGPVPRRGSPPLCDIASQEQLLRLRNSC